jgi:hypothetical protein
MIYLIYHIFKCIYCNFVMVYFPLSHSILCVTIIIYFMYILITSSTTNCYYFIKLNFTFLFSYTFALSGLFFPLQDLTPSTILVQPEEFPLTFPILLANWGKKNFPNSVCQKISILLSILKDIFTDHTLLCSHFSFNNPKISFHWDK